MRALSNIFAAAVLVGAVCATPTHAGPTPATAPAAANTAPGSSGTLLAIDQKTQFWFGVAVENIPPAIARQLKLKPLQGLMISEVLPGSPAEKAGLKAEDLLIEINDRPLTSQDDLFRAANPISKGTARPAPAKASKLAFLREGDRNVIEITPEQRPANMVVFTSPRHPNAPKMRNYVTPSGGGAQIGPGYLLHLNAADTGDFTARSIKSIVAKGQTVILSQETDVAGNVRNTITVGTTVYAVDPLHLDALPADLQPLAGQLISGSPVMISTATRTAAGTRAATDAAANASLEERVKDLEAKNARLVQQMDELLKHQQEKK